ncbi:MAG: helix-hairpin-helix domain-containing protein, partial [Prevotellaceae bacterium]|nr:helix-hairpin-helix domain-containing protein [Prevotellaceae bacterium]
MRKDLFYYYSKQDCIALIVLAVLIVAAVIFSTFFGGNNTSANDVEKDSLAIVADKQAAENASTQSAPYYNTEKRKVETFPFDPNTADSTQLLRLGLAPFQVRNIYRYRAAGGVYSRKEDFARLYGLTKGDYDRLAPYIRIADRFRPASDFVSSGSTYDRGKKKDNESKSLGETAENSTYKPKISHGEYVSVNAADTT